VYDSLYDRVDAAAKRKIEKTFVSKVKLVVPIVQKQQGYKDFGLFFCSICHTFGFWREFQRDSMLIGCIAKQHICVFHNHRLHFQSVVYTVYHM